MAGIMRQIVLMLWLGLLGANTCVSAQTHKKMGLADPADLNSPAWKKYDAKMGALRARAQYALRNEYAREQKDECQNLQSEAEKRNCLAHEARLTQNNYEEYAKALIALLRVRQPVVDPMELAPPDRGAKFEKAERAWISYRNTTCSAMSDAAWGGSIQGQIETGCLQDLTRRHMHELEALYKDE